MFSVSKLSVHYWKNKPVYIGVFSWMTSQERHSQLIQESMDNLKFLERGLQVLQNGALKCFSNVENKNTNCRKMCSNENLLACLFSACMYDAIEPCRIQQLTKLHREIMHICVRSGTSKQFPFGNFHKLKQHSHLKTKTHRYWQNCPQT